MGNRYREPRPHSPERLSLKSIDSVKHEDYAVEVQATFLFDRTHLTGRANFLGRLSFYLKSSLTVLSALSVSVNASPARNTQGFLTVTTILKTVRLWRKTSLLGRPLQPKPFMLRLIQTRALVFMWSRAEIAAVLAVNMWRNTSMTCSTIRDLRRIHLHRNVWGLRLACYYSRS